MFENGKQNQQLAAAPASGAGWPAGGHPGRQWDPSSAWARRLRLVASLHARIPDDALCRVPDGTAALQDSSTASFIENKGRKEVNKLSVLEHFTVGQRGPADLF